jgi:Cu2+-exporting ATPase
MTYKDELIPLGIGFFCFGNAMLFAMPEYVGLEDPGFIFFFRVLGLFCATLSLILAFGSTIKGSFTDLWTGRINLDHPIILGLLGAYFYSLFYLRHLSYGVYFDSISCIIALLLLGRYTKNRILEKALAQVKASTLGLDRRVHMGGKETPLGDVHKGAFLEFILGDLIPVKSQIVEGQGVYDLAALTGESRRYDFAPGQTLPAGAFIVEGHARGQALEGGQEGYLGLLEERAKGFLFEKSRWLQYSNHLGRIYLLALGVASVLLVCLLWTSLPQGEVFRRAASLLLMACPCSLGLSLPLIYSRSLQLGMAQGVLFRNTQSIERSAQIKTIYFDKTGTLSQGVLDLGGFSLLKEEAFLEEAFTQLPYASHHPVMVALQKKWPSHPTCTVEFTETPGEGFSFTYKKRQIRLGANPDLPNEKAIWLDGTLAASFSLGERLNLDSGAMIADLKAQGFAMGVLSGDQSQLTAQTAQTLGIPLALGQLSPEGKALSLTQNCAMVGNGVNDILAMAKSYLSVAVQGSVDSAREIADIYLLNPSLKALSYAFRLGQKAKRVFRLSLGIAFVYNGGILVLAALGLVTPLVASVLMPVSALSLILVSYGWSVSL